MDLFGAIKKLPNDAQAALNAQLQKLRDERALVRQKDATIEQVQDKCQALWDKLPKFLKPGVSSGVTIVSAAFGGALSAELEARDTAKVGYATAIPVIGLGLTGVALVLEDPDLSEVAAATGRGLAAPAVFNSAKALWAKEITDKKAAQAAKTQAAKA